VSNQAEASFGRVPDLFHLATKRAMWSADHDSTDGMLAAEGAKDAFPMIRATKRWRVLLSVG
jgi:hypothetical protein